MLLSMRGTRILNTARPTPKRQRNVACIILHHGQNPGYFEGEFRDVINAECHCDVDDFDFCWYQPQVVEIWV